MVEADQFIASSSTTSRRIGRSEVVHRMLLCAMVAGVEGAVAFALVLGVALSYHLLGLHVAVTEFNVVFYGGYALLTGLLYAVFAAIACSRFLERHLDAQLNIEQ